MTSVAEATSLADVTLKDISTRYTLKNELGSGAQATVYLGQSKGSGSSKVAIKVLPLAELEDDEVYEALRMECTLAKQLRHARVGHLWQLPQGRRHGGSEAANPRPIFGASRGDQDTD